MNTFDFMMCRLLSHLLMVWSSLHVSSLSSLPSLCCFISSHLLIYIFSLLWNLLLCFLSHFFLFCLFSSLLASLLLILLLDPLSIAHLFLPHLSLLAFHLFLSLLCFFSFLLFSSFYCIFSLLISCIFLLSFFYYFLFFSSFFCLLLCSSYLITSLWCLCLVSFHLIISFISCSTISWLSPVLRVNNRWLHQTHTLTDTHTHTHIDLAASQPVRDDCGWTTRTFLRL